jgi:anti-sigma factor (TIGR02949 family)
MATFSCIEVKEMVTDYLHKELDGENRTLVKEHLASCSECLSHYSTEAQISTLIISSSWNQESTQDIVSRVRLRIESEPEA